jgi:hypothetical protein
MDDMERMWGARIRAVHDRCLLNPSTAAILKHLLVILDLASSLPALLQEALLARRGPPDLREMEGRFAHHVQIFIHGIQGLSSYGASAMEGLASILEDFCPA